MLGKHLFPLFHLLGPAQIFVLFLSPLLGPRFLCLLSATQLGFVQVVQVLRSARQIRWRDRLRPFFGRYLGLAELVLIGCLFATGLYLLHLLRRQRRRMMLLHHLHLLRIFRNTPLLLGQFGTFRLLVGLQLLGSRNWPILDMQVLSRLEKTVIEYLSCWSGLVGKGLLAHWSFDPGFCLGLGCVELIASLALVDLGVLVLRVNLL